MVIGIRGVSPDKTDRSSKQSWWPFNFSSPSTKFYKIVTNVTTDPACLTICSRTQEVANFKYGDGVDETVSLADPLMLLEPLVPPAVPNNAKETKELSVVAPSALPANAVEACL